MHANMAFQSLATFDGVYATIPEGFRPYFGMMNTPCTLSGASGTFDGLMDIGADGAVRLKSFGKQANQAFATLSWMV